MRYDLLKWNERFIILVILFVVSFCNLLVMVSEYIFDWCIFKISVYWNLGIVFSLEIVKDEYINCDEC